jgi:hypothetical protein
MDENFNFFDFKVTGNCAKESLIFETFSKSVRGRALLQTPPPWGLHP